MLRRTSSMRGAHQTESSFPNIPAQSWYPPSVLSSLPGTSRSSTSNNLTPSELNECSRGGAIANTNVNSRSQSPSYSQLSPSTAGIIISVLRDRSGDELRTVLTDKEAYNKVLHSIGEVKHLDLLRDDLRKETTQLARKNLEKKSQIAEIKNQCTIIRTTELAVAQEKIHELEKRENDLVSLYAPAALIEKLRDVANATDEDSESLHGQLLAGGIELTDFVVTYKKLRTIYHRRTLLRLAAMASVAPD